MRYRPAILLLSLALLALGALFGRPPSAGDALAADPPVKTTPAAKEPEPGEEETPLTQEQKDKFALVLDNKAHTGPILALFFAPDRRELLSASMDCTIRSWDLDSGEPLRVYRPRLGHVSAAAFSRDGRTVAVAGLEDKEHVIDLINLETDQVTTFKSSSHKDRLNALAFSPDGKWLAGSSAFQNICLYDVEKGSLYKEWTGAGARAYALAFDSQSKNLLTISKGDKLPRAWPVPDGNKSVLSQGPNRPITRFGGSPDGKHMVLAGPGGAFLWDVPENRGSPLLNHIARGFAFSADSQKLLYHYAGRGEDKAAVKVRDVTTGKEKTCLDDHLYSQAALSVDGKLGAVVDAFSDEIAIFNTDDGKVVHRLTGRALPAVAAGWSPDGKDIAFGYEAGKLPDDRFQGRNSLSSAFSLDKMRFLSRRSLDRYQRAILQRDDQSLDVGPERTVIVKRAMRIETVIKPLGSPLCATFVAKGQVVVGSSLALELFDTSNGKRLCRFLGHEGGVVAVAASPDGKHLLSAGQDMTLRIWELAKAREVPKDTFKPILSLFVARNRSWIAWNQGYFAASPDGEQLMGWQVDNGPGKLSSFYTADQFRKAFYRPDVIPLIRQEGSLERALWLADKAREPIAIEDVLPPRVTITQPASSSLRLDKPELTIEAVAESSGKDPVTALQLLLDGRPYPPESARQPVANPRTGKTAPVPWKIQLPPGRHRLSVQAQTDTSSGSSEEIWVTNTAAPPKPRLFVLLVGINEYVKFNKLNCAVQDAEALKGAFAANAKPPLFDKVEARLIKDPEATRDGILKGLDWLKDNANEEDVAVVFYAGHGDKDDKGLFHLVTVDAGPGKLPETAVSGAEFKARLAALKSRRVLLLLDACHSGAIGNDNTVRDPTAIGLDDLARDLKRSDCGVVVLCGALGSEYSLESQKEGHGYFTKALLAGLKGEGETRNKDGEITLSRLNTFVQEMVPDFTQDRQHPVLVGNAIRSFSLAKP
jgi:WD40 repeat protein